MGRVGCGFVQEQESVEAQWCSGCLWWTSGGAKFNGRLSYCPCTIYRPLITLVLFAPRGPTNAHHLPGKSYCTRTVDAIQKGRNIFVCEVSFHVPEESQIDHQYLMPKVEAPDTFPTREELVQGILNDPLVTPAIGNTIRFHVFEPFDLEIRFTEPIDVQKIKRAEPKEPRQAFWVRVSHKLPDDSCLHQCIAAYATDHLLLSTSLRPVGLYMWNPRVTFMASIDHCIWFHKPFRVDEWLLYEMESPRANNGRGFALGRLYDQRGSLVLSCAQEGVVRVKSKL